jgi:hypothetical protein
MTVVCPHHPPDLGFHSQNVADDAKGLLNDVYLVVSQKPKASIFSGVQNLIPSMEIVNEKTSLKLGYDSMEESSALKTVGPQWAEICKNWDLTQTVCEAQSV